MSECAQTIEWAGGKHVFNLNNKRVLQIIDLCGFPGHNGDTPAACIKRFQDETYSIADVEAIIELGLVGGGLSPREAENLLDAHVRGKPLAPNVLIAMAVLSALFVGKEENADASA